MKRIALVLLMLAVGGAGFAAGVVAKAKLKFPYACEALNKPCGKTMLEWKCAQAKVDAKPLPMRNWFDVVSLTVVPGKHRLSVKVDLRPKRGVKITKANAGAILNDTIYFHLRGYVRKRICEIPDDFRNAEIVVSVNGTPAAKRDGGGFVMLMKL